MQANITDIGHIIQLSIAPVFLLVGIGSFINVFSGRLARVVDRARVLEARGEIGDEQARRAVRDELRTLSRRSTLVYVGISLGILSAFLVCLLVVLAFIGHFLNLQLSAVIGICFAAAMLALMFSLLLFLREVFLAVRSLVIGRTTAEVGPPQHKE